MTDPALSQAISRVAAVPRLLVATDFDGVLAPLVDDPMTSRALPGDLEALRGLADLPETGVALVSGRDLATLLALTGVDPASEPIVAFGSHGAQSTSAEPVPLDEAQQHALDDLERLTTEHVAAHPGTRLERKPAARVVHTRGLAPELAGRSTQELLESVTGRPHVHVLVGKDVVELSVVDANKGAAVLGLAQTRAADAVVYLGDDVTDEHVFTRLGPDDLGIKVGAGETAAAHRVADCAAVTEALQALLLARRGHLAG